jgi:dipeptidyl aminopeptidase/acylaminoacyl peptidase
MVVPRSIGGWPMGRVLFAGPARGHMFVAKSDGASPRQLTGDSFKDRVPRWSPDGKWIAWFSDRAGKLQIWKIRFDGSDLQQLTDVDGRAAYFAWSPDGQRMAITAQQTGDDVVIVLDPSRPWAEQQPLRGSPLSKRYRVTGWSPDGTQLARRPDRILHSTRQRSGYLAGDVAVGGRRNAIGIRGVMRRAVGRGWARKVAQPIPCIGDEGARRPSRRASSVSFDPATSRPEKTQKYRLNPNVAVQNDVSTAANGPLAWPDTP